MRVRTLHLRLATTDSEVTSDTLKMNGMMDRTRLCQRMNAGRLRHKNRHVLRWIQRRNEGTMTETGAQKKTSSTARTKITMTEEGLLRDLRRGEAKVARVLGGATK